LQYLLGLDPGTRFTGYGVISRAESGDLKLVEADRIVLADGAPLAERLAKLGQELEARLGQRMLHEVAVEKVFLGKNVASAFSLGHARGVCLMWAAQRGLKVSEYAARFVKKAVTGYGAADKDQVAVVVARMLGSSQVLPVDATDALALAMAHAQELTRQRVLHRLEGSP
jgi:crossover junction endodeoxyribonuclease RuvC